MSIKLVDNSETKGNGYEKVKEMNDLSKEQAIEMLRHLNSFRSEETVWEFLSEIMGLEEELDSGVIGKEEYAIMVECAIKIFPTLVDFIFQDYSKAKYFTNEKELEGKKLILKG